MRSPFIAFFLFTLLLLLSARLTNVFAQGNEEAHDGEVVRVRTDLVTVPAFVTDARGRRVPGLTRADFMVRDDGRPVEVEYFGAGTERVALAFALDVSGSAREIITRQHEAALALFSRFGRGSRVAVLRFAERSELAVPFTTAADEARSAFSFPALPGHRTAIFDAAAAIRAFDARGGDPAERRILILISDGLDTVSTMKAPAVIIEAQAHGVSIYVIHLPIFAPRDGRLAPRPPSKGFRELAEKTGGRYFVVGDARSALDPRAEYDFGPVFKSIEEDLQGQYVLGYYPGEGARDGRFHRVEINLTARNLRKLRVRQLREGYTISDR